MAYNKEYIVKNNKYKEIVILKNSRRYEEAIEKLLEFNSEYPGDIYGIVDYAVCLIKTNKKDEGIEILENLIKRKNKIKKLDYVIYSELLDTYGRRKEFEKCKELLIDSISILDSYEIQLLKIKYLYHLGSIFKAEELLNQLKPRSLKDEATLFNLKLHYCNNEYLRENRKQIEKSIKQYINKSVLSLNSGRKLYLKLYIACNNDEEAYKYMNINIDYRPDKLLESYKICKRLGKKEEMNEYLDKLNKCDKTLLSKNTQIELLYLNGKKNEAFDQCIELSKTDIDSLLLLTTYSIKLDRIEEAIDAIKLYLNDKDITDYKIIAVIQRLIDLLIYKQRYNEAYLYLEKYNIYLREFIKEQYYIYLSKKINIKYESSNINTYFISQLRNYDYDSVIRHISKHKYQNKEKAVHTIFTDNIPVEELLKIIRPHLTKENLYEVGVINRYEIDCENIDINENKIITGLIDDKFIFCFPSMKDVEELEELEEDLSKPKIKRLTQIEKFNKKYNLDK